MLRCRCGKSKSSRKFKEFKEFVDFFWVPNALCLTLGIDINDSISYKWKPLLWFLTTFELATHCFTRSVFVYKFFYALMQRDMELLWNAASLIIYAVDSNVKLLVLFLHRKRLRKVYNTLKSHYPIDSDVLELYRVNEHHATVARPILVLYNYIACSLIIMGPLLESVLTYIYDWFQSPAECIGFRYLKHLPIEYSFDYTQSVAAYLFAYFIEMVSSMFTVHSLLGSDMWLLCLTAQIIMHFRYFARCLENYQPSEENDVQDCKFLAAIIEKHQLMLHLHKDLNHIFGLSLATNLFTISCLLCFVAVQLTIHKMGTYFFKYALFQITVIGNFYIIYSYGQLLTTSSTDIALAAYKSQWYQGSRAYKKLLLILIMRSQRQAELTAKGYQKICLNTFQSVLIMSYRVFAVLRTAIDFN